MAFQVNEKLPRTYFPDIINSHIMMVKAYLDALDTPIVLSPCCGPVTVFFRFYTNVTKDATPLLCYTFSNLGDPAKPVIPVLDTTFLLDKRALII